MIEIKTDTAKYKPEYVGMVHYCKYWHKYSLVIAVEDNWVTELDSFGGINHCNEHDVRRHLTSLRYGDKLLTVSEFAQLIGRGE